MIDKTAFEKEAIKVARRNLAEVLAELGLLAPFHNRTPAEIDRIIEACVDGFQEAIGRLVREQRDAEDALGGVPF